MGHIQLSPHPNIPAPLPSIKAAVQDLTVQVLLLLCCVISPGASIAAALQNLAPSTLGFGCGWWGISMVILFLQLCVCDLHQRELRLMQKLGMGGQWCLCGAQSTWCQGMLS